MESRVAIRTLWELSLEWYGMGLGSRLMPRDSANRYIHANPGVFTNATILILRPSVGPGRTLQPSGEAFCDRAIKQDKETDTE